MRDKYERQVCERRHQRERQRQYERQNEKDKYAKEGMRETHTQV
jgi:hypothetical protein